MRINGVSTIELAHVGPPPADAPAAVFASFGIRASALNSRLFTSVGDVGPVLEILLIAAAVIFLLLGIAGLATGFVLTRTITSSVDDLYKATLHVRRGDFTQRVRVHQRDQLGALGESFNEMTSSIAELIEEQSKRQKLENEIVIAREVQSQLFPQVLPTLPGLELAAICRPARVVSGDYYDFIRTGTNTVGIALADISGKGIFAALLMASLQATLRSHAGFDGLCGNCRACLALESASLPQYFRRSLRDIFLRRLRRRGADTHLYERRAPCSVFREWHKRAGIERGRHRGGLVRGLQIYAGDH